MRRVNICGLQAYRWKGGPAAKHPGPLLEGQELKFKFFWWAQESAQGGVGFLLAEKWVNQVCEVQRISDRIMLLKFIVSSTIFTFVSLFVPQSGLLLMSSHISMTGCIAELQGSQPRSASSRLVTQMIMSVLLPVWTVTLKGDRAEVYVTQRGRGCWNSPLPMGYACAAPSSRRGTRIWLHTPKAAIWLSWTTFFIAGASAVLSATWCSSLYNHHDNKVNKPLQKIWSLMFRVLALRQSESKG